MKNIEKRFKYFQKNRPGRSTLINFSDAVMDQNFNKEKIIEEFDRLVDVSDFDPKDKKGIIAYFCDITKPSIKAREKWFRIRY